MAEHHNEDQNINNVEIPAILYERIKTGIDWLDKALTEESGLVPSLVYMLSGRPGAGKSTLVRQLSNGLTGDGHIVLLNSGEESKEQIAIATKRMQLKHGWIWGNDTDHRKLIVRLNGLIAKHPDKKIILVQDSLQKLIRGGSIATACDALKQWAKETKQTVIIICQVTKKGEFRGGNDILHDIDVELKLNVDKKTGNRSFVVQKNRFGPETDEDGISYVITASGLELRYDPDDVEDENEDSDDEEAESVEFKKRQMVVCNKKASPKHRGKVGKVKKVGRTRLTVITLKGEELYLPIDHFSPAPVTEPSEPTKTNEAPRPHLTVVS